MTRLIVASGIDVGAATITGAVRTENEDDFLVVSLPADSERPLVILLAVADGMGGLAGGREASRAALRALGEVVVQSHATTDGEAILRAGFAAAAARLAAIARDQVRLAEMGTTLTSLWISGDQAWIGHVGDSRLYRLRGGRREQVTADHALTEPRHMLTRCLGAGQTDSDGDFLPIDLSPGDRFVLCTDGVWSVLDDDVLARTVAGAPPQPACEKVCRLVLGQGAPDNATVLVLDYRPDESGEEVELDVPTAETMPRLEAGTEAPLRPSRWPWWLLFAALVGLLVAWWRMRGASGA
ncbi:MAG: PP2C family serine/threonine-protein phosphatase [Planctomycetota bacterium]